MKDIEHRGINMVWAELMVEELVRNQAEFFCLSPGSRCSPLTLAAARNGKAVKTIHYDERGAAFHALGHVRATMRPAVLICTSGTAAANYLPAVVEASADNLPLIILTGDRPPELRQAGANQAIDQANILEDYVRWKFDMPAPGVEIPPEFVLSTVDQAVYRATRAPAGPVHINCMFREPLVASWRIEELQKHLAGISSWRRGRLPRALCAHPSGNADQKTLQTIISRLSGNRNRILIVGGLSTEKDRKAVLKLSTRLNWPAFFDITSGLRLGATNERAPLCCDLLLSDLAPSLMRRPAVLHIGGQPVSKNLLEFLNKTAPSEYILINNHPFRQDPLHKQSMRVECDIASACAALAARLGAGTKHAPLNRIVAASRKMENMLVNELDGDACLSEPAVARLISWHISPAGCLFLGNSMPVRDMNQFATPSGFRVPVGCNRGASGIDGTIASAVGFARGLGRPLTVLIGDLAFLHDMNSLNLIKRLACPAAIIVINNNGAGIFSFLPIRRQADVFEEYFGAPHGLSFKGVAEMFGLGYVCPASREEFVAAYASAQKERGGTILEMTADRNENLKVHDLLRAKFVARLGARATTLKTPRRKFRRAASLETGEVETWPI